MKAIPRPPVPTEEEEQKEFFRWVEMIIDYGVIPELETIFHIPNSGAGPSRGMAGRMKAMGVRRGVCDVFWPFARDDYHGLFIEFKRQKGGRVSPEQQKFIDMVTKAGYMAIVAKGANEAKQAIISYYGLSIKLLAKWREKIRQAYNEGKV